MPLSARTDLQETIGHQFEKIHEKFRSLSPLFTHPQYCANFMPQTPKTGCVLGPSENK
jgi:hypothetical protein